MCECLKIAGEKIEAELLKQIPEGAQVSKDYFDTGWENRMLNIQKGTSFIALKYRMAYRAKKKNGEMAKNLNRLSVSIDMRYCPLCGEAQ